MLSIGPFLPGISGEFIEDDLTIIRDNPNLQSLSRLSDNFTSTYWRDQGRGGLYRPVTVTSYALDRLLFGEENLEGSQEGARPPSLFGLHLTNILLNLAAVLLLFALLRRTVESRAAAWFGAALFAVHPVHVEAVVHLVGRADVIMTVFFLAAYLCHRSTGARVAAPFLFLAALGCKEMAAVLPALLLVENLLLERRRPFRDFLFRQIRELWPFAAAFLLFMIARGFVLGPTAEPPQIFALYIPGQYVAFADPAGGEIALTMTHAFGEYLLLLFFPLWLSADYSGFPHATGFTGPVLLSAFALVVLIAGTVVLFIKGHRRVVHWIVSFWIILLPVSNLIVTSGIIMAERALYLPSICFAAVFAFAVAWLGRKKRALLSIPVILVALCVVRSTVESRTWLDPASHFQHTVANGRHHGHIALTGLAGEYLRVLRLPDDEFSEGSASIGHEGTTRAELRSRALSHARRSIAQNTNPVNMQYLAMLLQRDGAIEESWKWWSHLLDTDPGRADFRTQVLSLMERLIELRVAEGELGEAVQLAVKGGSVSAAGHDSASQDRWSRKLDELYERFIQEAIDRNDWVTALSRVLGLQQNSPGHPLIERFQRPVLEGAITTFREQIQRHVAAANWVEAARACGTLRRFNPTDPILARHQIPAYEGAVRSLLEQGNRTLARKIAGELLMLDANNAVARSALN